MGNGLIASGNHESIAAFLKTPKFFQVKPLLSLDNQEARLRVIALYKAWWRQIPIMLSQMPMPVTQQECQKMLKTQFVKHKDIKDTRIIDVLVVKVSQFSHLQLGYSVLKFLRAGSSISLLSNPSRRARTT